MLGTTEANFYFEGECWYFLRFSALPLFTDFQLTQSFHLLCPFLEILTLIPRVLAYFTRAHPLYPFLDRKAFEDALLAPSFSQEPQHNKAWFALYNAVLALGCQLCGEGSYQPGKGKSWGLFSTSMSVFPELLSLPDSILVLQALTAMSLFSLSIPCLAIEHVIIHEAARRAQNLRSHKLPECSTLSYQKAFWILYSVEKISSFHFGRPSVSHKKSFIAFPSSAYVRENWPNEVLMCSRRLLITTSRSPFR